jgi:hypothetical protein
LTSEKNYFKNSALPLFIRKLCQDKLKIAHFESGTPYENPNNINSGNTPGFNINFNFHLSVDTQCYLSECIFYLSDFEPMQNLDDLDLFSRSKVTEHIPVAGLSIYLNWVRISDPFPIQKSDLFSQFTTQKFPTRQPLKLEEKKNPKK